ncbi:hypothetical protein MAR_013110, partial [Mya arenaria]
VNLKPLDEEEIVGIKTKSKDCKYPQLRPFDGSKKNVDPVEMIVRCPDAFIDANVTTKCEENYILNSNSGSYALNLLRPVSSKMNNMTFKNYFCAKCHDFDDNRFTQWETTLTCDSMASEIPNIQSFRDIYPQLAIHDHCNVAFRPPLDFYPQVCEYGISRCNQTGKWRVYDDMLEKACLSYTSTYKFQYKNVHCALCNGFEREDVEPFCGSNAQMDPVSSQFSFLALLDFTGLEDGEDQFESDCSSGMIYDIFQRKCREIFCPKSYFLDGNECRPVINGESRYTFGPFSVISMDITFHLKPLGSLGEDSLSTFELSSDTNVARILYNKLMIPPLGQHRQARVEICNLRSFLKMTKSMNETIEEIRQTNESALLSNIDFIGIHVQLKVFDFTDLTSLIDHTASVIRGTELMFQDLHLIYQAFDDLTFLDYHTTLGFDFKTFLRVIDLNASAITTTRLLGSFDGADGLGIMPLFNEEDTWP